MSHAEYEASEKLSLEAHTLDYDAFYSLLMAAIREADIYELDLLRDVFPDTVSEFELRYNAPGGYLPGEERR